MIIILSVYINSNIYDDLVLRSSKHLQLQLLKPVLLSLQTQPKRQVNSQYQNSVFLFYKHIQPLTYLCVCLYFYVVTPPETEKKVSSYLHLRTSTILYQFVANYNSPRFVFTLLKNSLPPSMDSRTSRTF
jgi:hypothetical protein